MLSYRSLSQHLAVAALLLLGVCAAAQAQNQNPDGSYRLVMRKLADGTVLTPPTVQGMGTFKNGVYQLVVLWRTPEGKPASLWSLSKWEWSDNEVVATPMASMFDDGSGKAPAYTVGGEAKRVPVARQGRRISHPHPLDPVYMVWDGDKETASLEGVFTDYWERVR